ncbi:acetyl-CoA carboxylase biotin carboxyl carrier protein subunit, partial [Streptosporangium algeriense]
ARRPRRQAAKAGGTAGGADAVTSPMQGTIVKVAVGNGDRVATGDLIVVLEAMKMEQPLFAHKAGTVAQLDMGVGDAVSGGHVLCLLHD